MKGRAAARRYAKALIDLAARDDMVADIGEQLQQHRDLFQANVELQGMLWHPGIAAEVKTNLLTGILERTQPAPLLRSFILLLQDKDRLRQFELICEHYERMANARLRRVVARVTTAIELDADQQQAVSQKLIEITQQQVLLETRLDPSILGGLIVHINHTVLDGSLRGQLTRLRQDLIGG
ncbi:ATP synthase subunit delta [Candidatus Entotheonellaceae bacterium PAL068K]